MHRTDDRASLPHGSAPALHRYRDDGHLRLNGHDEASLLEREELAGAAACPFRKDQEGIARTQRFGAALDGGHGPLPIVSFDGDEAADVERGPHDRKLVQFGLVEDVQLRVKRLEQDRGIDIALVVRAEDHRAGWNMLPPAHTVADACHRQRDAHPGVAECVESALPPEYAGKQEPERPRDRDVDEHRDISNDGPDCGDDHRSMRNAQSGIEHCALRIVH
jgi:hypothetical protein